MAKNISLLGADYPDVPAVVLPKTGGGSATFTDTSDSTVKASDMKDGVIAYNSNGEKIVGLLDTDVVVTNFTGTVSLISGDDYKININ